MTTTVGYKSSGRSKFTSFRLLSESNNEELIYLLKARGHKIQKITSTQLTYDFVDNSTNINYIIANFLGLREEVKKSLQ